MEEDFKSYRRLTLALILLIVGIVGNSILLIYAFSDIEDVNDKLQIAVEENWNFYLDGSHVDESKLSLGDYKATFSEENKEVYLTKPIYIRRNYRTNTTLVPYRY